MRYKKRYRELERNYLQLITFSNRIGRDYRSCKGIIRKTVLNPGFMVRGKGGSANKALFKFTDTEWRFLLEMSEGRHS